MRTDRRGFIGGLLALAVAPKVAPKRELTEDMLVEAAHSAGPYGFHYDPVSKTLGSRATYYGIRGLVDDGTLHAVIYPATVQLSRGLFR